MSALSVSARRAHVCDFAMAAAAHLTMEATTVCHLEAGVTHPVSLFTVADPVCVPRVADPMLSVAVSHPIGIVPIAIVPIAIIAVPIAIIAIAIMAVAVAPVSVTDIGLFIAVANNGLLFNNRGIAVAVSGPVAITVSVIAAATVAVAIAAIPAVGRRGNRGADQRASGKP